MHKRRVVITGLGAVSPFGWGLSALTSGLEKGECALSLLSESDSIEGIKVRVRGAAPYFDIKAIAREHRRAMSHMGIMAFVAASEALRQAGIAPTTPLDAPYRNMGSSIASTTVSPNTLESFFATYLTKKQLDTVKSTVFFKVMSHAVPSTLNVTFGLSGRCLAPAAACASALQAIGLAYETIAFGRADLMLGGGAEEYHVLLSATFDRIGAASHSTLPQGASRPFDLNRDGIVCSEGAGIVVLEEYQHAIARGAHILAEIVGFGTNTSPTSIVFPDENSIENCMRQALDDAALAPDAIDLVNAHATATTSGDIAEGQAIERVFGKHTPVNSLKGYFGHCMAASGSLELMAVIDAARKGFIHGTHNLASSDPRCGELMLDSKHKNKEVAFLLKNSFGLGGANASLVVKL